MQQTSVSESSYRSFLKHLFAALSDHLSGRAINKPTFSVRCREVLLYNADVSIHQYNVYNVDAKCVDPDKTAPKRAVSLA